MFKTYKYCADLIFSFLLPGTLQRPAPDVNFGGLGWIWAHVGTLWTSLWTSAGIFFGNVCAVEFLFVLLLDFVGFCSILCAGRGSQ